jgi:hypothetical protein
MKAILLAIPAIIALCLPLGARTWTSSDGAKTFEGELRSYDGASGKITVLLASGKSLTFTQDKLSGEDITFLKEYEADANKPDPAELLKEQVIGGKLVKAKLQRLAEKKFAKAELETVPEYYLLYFSGSW